MKVGQVEFVWRSHRQAFVIKSVVSKEFSASIRKLLVMSCLRKSAP